MLPYLMQNIKNNIKLTYILISQKHTFPDLIDYTSYMPLHVTFVLSLTPGINKRNAFSHA